MSKCPDCGQENVLPPDGAAVHCGRRVAWASIAAAASMDWKTRMGIADACRKAGERRRDLQKSDKE